MIHGILLLYKCIIWLNLTLMKDRVITAWPPWEIIQGILVTQRRLLLWFVECHGGNQMMKYSTFQNVVTSLCFDYSGEWGVVHVQPFHLFTFVGMCIMQSRYRSSVFVEVCWVKKSQQCISTLHNTEHWMLYLQYFSIAFCEVIWVYVICIDKYISMQKEPSNY